MKTNKMLYWVSTGIIFFWCGIMSLVFFNSDASREGMAHYGYPPFFGPMVNVFSIIGSVLLVWPGVPARVKEWVYFGFALNFIGAAVSNWAVDGFGFQVIFPLLFFVPLLGSYFLYHKERAGKAGV